MGGAEQTRRKEKLENETRKHKETVISTERLGHWRSNAGSRKKQLTVGTGTSDSKVK
jgi:hypothetical protein